MLLAAAALAFHAGLTGFRAAAEAGTPAAVPPAAAHLTEAQARSYAFRQRQLEADLRRDATDYEVLVRLGQLHLQLAEDEGDIAASHLRRARHYLLLAGAQAEFRSDAYLVHALLDAANEPRPTIVLSTLTGEAAPLAHDDEEWIRWRLGALHERLRFQPRSSRLLRLLGDNYVALSLIQDLPGPTLHQPLTAGLSIADRRLARQCAQACYGRAIVCARTHEALCRALYRQAELLRECREPRRAAAYLKEVLRIQPNQWQVALEVAALDRQLGQSAGAERFQSLAARWRTPSWL